MRILVAHNSYQMKGGEDAVFKAEVKLLREKGHEVVTYERSNKEIQSFSFSNKFRQCFEMGHSEKSYTDIQNLIRKYNPDLVHFHNIFFMITPAAYFACIDYKIPIVQSLHNFRLFRLDGCFYPEKDAGKIDVKKELLKGVFNKNFHHSYFLSWMVARMIWKHWQKGTWQKCINRYILATEFGKRRMIEAGLPENKISVKPNVIDMDPAFKREEKDFFIFVGRLSPEKGLDLLLQAWKSNPEIKLKIIGDGPLREHLIRQIDAYRLSHVEVLGHVSQEVLDQFMREAKGIIVPSRCYENFPRIVAESFSYGLPVIATSLGGFSEIIQNGENGFLIDPYDAAELSSIVRKIYFSEVDTQKLSQNSRKAFVEKFSLDKNYETLMGIYELAINN